jgi:hypothetical protein
LDRLRERAERGDAVDLRAGWQRDDPGAIGKPILETAASRVSKDLSRTRL